MTEKIPAMSKMLKHFFTNMPMILYSKTGIDVSKLLIELKFRTLKSSVPEYKTKQRKIVIKINYL